MEKKTAIISLLLVGLVLLAGAAAIIVYQNQNTGENSGVKVATGSSLSIFTDIAEVYGTYESSGAPLSDVLITDARPELLIHGDVDFQLAQTFPYLKAISNGAPVKLVGEVSDKNPIMLVVAENEKSDIKNISDLKGKSVLVLSPGTSPYKIAVQSMKKAGLNVDEDVNLISIGKPSPQVVLSMFENGEADAAFLPPHLIAPLIAKGDAALLNVTLKPMLNAGIFVTTKTIRENRDTVKAFVEGTNETLKILQQKNSDEIAQKLLSNPDIKEHYAGYDEKSLSIYVELMKKVLANNVTISEKDFANTLNFAKDMLGSELTFDEVCDTSFAGKR